MMKFHVATAASANQIEVNNELQVRFLSAARRNLVFGALMVAGIAAFLWPHADHTGLVIWVLLVTLTRVPAAVMQSTKPSFESFYKLSAASEFLSGIAWGLGTIIAMPQDSTGQLILLMLLIGVLMSSASNGAHFLGIFLIGDFPMAALVCTGFILNTDWPIAPFVGFWVLGFIYVTAAAYEARETQSALVQANLDLGAANRQLDVQARTDELTGLSNRLDFTEQLHDRIVAWGEEPAGHPSIRPVTLAFLDIDGFKQINDELGHHAGDAVLREAARRLCAASTADEVVARLGGDELTVISSVDAHSLGARVLACFDEPHTIDGRPLEVRCSVGVAMAERETTVASLMRNADAALYSAKDHGGRQHRAFGATIKMKDERRLTIEAELHDALVNGLIVPWLQPIVDLETGHIVGAEALARWEHADGVRSAAAFIDVLPTIGLMGEFTEQLLHAIATFQSSLDEQGIDLVPITINVPGSHLRQVVDTALPFPLVLEITEKSAIGDVVSTRRALLDAQRAGHQVWLDDFGTGFSSMSLAADLPIDGLKIDREFVARVASSPAVDGVVGAIVELGRRMSLDVIASGVEHHGQTRLLRDFGISMAQGHVWSPAIPLEEFTTLLRARHRFDVHGDGAFTSTL